MRLSPLNIVLACVMVWAISEFGEDGDPLFSWGWLLLLVFVLSVVDILIRLWTKDIQKLWFLQIAFILVVGIGSVVVKLM